MSRRVHLSVVATVAAALVVGLAGGVGGAVARTSEISAAPGAVDLQLVKCSRGKKASKRSAVFRGEMTQIAEAERMRMRFDLSEKIGKGKWRGIAPVELRVWRESSPGVTRFAYRQKVKNLKEATSYRMRVQFQWIDGDGEVVARTHVESKACRQRGKLPNLAFRDDIHVRPGPTPGTFGYSVRIHNNGLVPTPRTELVLRANGAEVDVRAIGRLKPGARRLIRFVGPECQTTTAAQIDPKDLVREISEADNQITVPCERALFPPL